MFLSRIHLNPHRRKTRAALANPQIMHAMVASSLPPGMESSDKGRLLWRVDRDGHDVRLYIVSPYKPGLEHIVEQAGWESDPGQTTDYTRFLNHLAIGREFDFRVTLNPVIQQWVAGSRGSRIPICGPKNQLSWLQQRTEQWGFRIVDYDAPEDTIEEGSRTRRNHVAVRILEEDNRSFEKRDHGNRRRVTQRHVTFLGQLTVTDVALLRRALTHGMGRGKAYGCGLMSLAQVR
ncbi:type I-E CRISPR-associated protein Cas6/Cse3/CasE [Bowdeniella nasicola]|uniref:Type I-E CRISPR-associated protein Cas6/Cse3/CasE n=1 Tax=Bowdeniella nasicola TaxID=208480 RepID=A0A1Q5PZ54_9ACTO|nr:type I-E CRISPR-associated protein Cas6/Cse3/CasE [Bowdeniella nasicola]OKL52913.1 type I-E CRISPR-associated protein Cas6/Cse3/CasE [Bowdeniella nasicola]